MATLEECINDIAVLTRDYEGEYPKMDPHRRVSQWINQFPKAKQIDILVELHNVLSKTYFSKEKVLTYLSNIIFSNKITGGSPSVFWKAANFIRTQGGGNSLKELLALLNTLFIQHFGYSVDDCGSTSGPYIYIDDFIFSGGRVKADVESWITDHAPQKATLLVICIAVHRYGLYSIWTKPSSTLKSAIKNSGKEINILFKGLFQIENTYMYKDVSDVLRPTAIPSELTDHPFIHSLIKSKYGLDLRQPGSIGQLKIFSSEKGRSLLEKEFLIKGIEIKYSLCTLLPPQMKPLGNTWFDNFGFGSLFLTYRNCPNNCPLVFWVNEPWNALFPRITNT